MESGALRFLWRRITASKFTRLTSRKIPSISPGKKIRLKFQISIFFSERAAESNFSEKIIFEQADVLAKEFEDGQFDLIFAKDSLKHIRQEFKSELFEKFERWLKPGGRLVIAGNVTVVLFSFLALFQTIFAARKKTKQKNSVATWQKTTTTSNLLSNTLLT